MSTQEEQSLTGIHNLGKVSDSNASQFQVLGQKKRKKKKKSFYISHYFEVIGSQNTFYISKAAVGL